ncbi:MAG TPA: GNAT family N-acetyltransferase [Prosthecobacter sp.]|nr:GNAT family N-acetyltransferase [Prosthecobacter sp.]
MIDYALEKYPVRYPLETSVQCLIRPLEPADDAGFLKFLHQVPEFERLFIKQRLDNPALVKEWCADVDYDARLPLLACADGQVVGLATLEQRHGGWKRHIGMTHLLTHPEYRGVGLAGMLIREIIEVARHCGLSHLQAEFNAERQLAIRAFAESGFHELMRLPDYVKDMQAKTHAYVLMGMNLTTDIENTGAGD